jgi:hypothetical protein
MHIMENRARSHDQFELDVLTTRRDPSSGPATVECRPAKLAHPLAAAQPCR